MTSLIGKNVGSYRVLAATQLGESGLVHKALHIAKRQTYALKLLHGALTVESPLQRQFLDRLRAAESLDHPHIGRTYAVEVADDLSIIPLEFVYGRNLSEKIAEGASTTDFVLRSRTAKCRSPSICPCQRRHSWPADLQQSASLHG